MTRISVLLAFVCIAGAAQAQTAATPAPAPAPAPVVVGSAAPGPVADKLIITDLQEGSGTAAITGNTVRVNYTGWLYRPLARNSRGMQFDSSIPRGEPLEFKIGRGQVIKGWDQGVVGMKVGGKRTLIIPSDLAYGKNGQGNIPPNSALIFEVEMVEIK